jgi:hypothetical protein
MGDDYASSFHHLDPAVWNWMGFWPHPRRTRFYGLSCAVRRPDTGGMR